MPTTSSDVVTIIVDDKPVECRRGRPLLNELLNAGFVVSTSCGGKGTCHLCRVTVLNREAAGPASQLEKKALGNVLIAAGMRLSCQVEAADGLRVSLPIVESKAERRARLARERRSKEEE